MKRICFISIGNVYMAPYIKNYTKHLRQPYTIIFWDRANCHEYDNLNEYFCFSYPCKSNNKLKKIIGYVRFYFFTRKILLKNEFDLVIVLQTCAALLIAGILKRYYNKKYAIDIRDYTYEKYIFIRMIEKQLIKQASFVIISSEGYKRFLPKYNYLMSHNMQVLPQQNVARIRMREKMGKKCLHIAYIGYVNYQEQHKKLILALKDDDRFRLSFIGTRATELNKFIEENKVQNVFTYDTFKPEEILDFYEDVDFVNNLYGNHTPTLDYALSNKLYIAAELHIPILVCPDTYMSEIVSKYTIGTVVDIGVQNLGDLLYDYYKSIDWMVFCAQCKRFLREVYEEQKRFDEYIEIAFNDEELKFSHER